MGRVVKLIAVACVCATIVLSAGRAFAQESASIVGLVRDASGAVMPGVTIEASSPVLIEKVRSVVTDGAGRFAIISLRPGAYVVTFSLPGFKTIRREGIVLEGAFAATVNADLEVGSLEESVTVTGASPVVDLQSTQNQFVANKDVLDALPATRSMQGGASLVPGVNFYSQGFVSTMSVHGSASADQRIYQDGMRIGQNLTGTGSQAQRDRRQRSRTGRTGVRRRLAIRGNGHWRRPHGLDPQGRWQQVRWIVAHVLLQRFHAERQRAGRPAPVHPRRRRARLQLQYERHVRRSRQAGPALVLRGVQVHQRPTASSRTCITRTATASAARTSRRLTVPSGSPGSCRRTTSFAARTTTPTATRSATMSAARRLPATWCRARRRKLPTSCRCRWPSRPTSNGPPR